MLCLVDDAQWLDTPSADALVFASRRLDAEGIVVLFATREGDERRFEAHGLRDLVLSGLDDDAAGELLVRYGAVAPSVRDLLVRQAGGNPLALVELPAALSQAQLAGTEPLPDTIPLTPDVERLFLTRVRRLPEETQRLLLLVSADDSGLLAPVLGAAEALGVRDRALSAAEEAGLVVVRGPRIDVRHPLLRSAVYQGASSSERRAAHLALAESFDSELEADRVAWHRAAAALGHDSAVADELERTAERARLRSGHAAAASALERASELSVDAALRGRRLVAAAAASWQSGQPERALALLDRASPIVIDQRVKAEIAHLRGDIGLRRGSLLEACAILVAGADNVASLDPSKALEMLTDAGALAGRTGDVGRMVEVGRMIAALPRSGDPMEALLADLAVGVSGILEGRSASAVQLVQESIPLARESDDPRLLSWAIIGASTLDDHLTEAALLARAMAVARASGAVDTVVLVLEALVATDIGGGRYTAEAEATEGLRLAREVGLPNLVTAHLAALAWMAALRGNEEECRAYAAEVTKAVKTSAQANANSWAEWGVGMLDLSLGRPEATVTRLAALRSAPIGVGHPYFMLMSSPEFIEACVRAGGEELAHEAFDVLDGFARSGAPAWARAYAARCRALLAGDGSAEQSFEEALELHAQTQRLFDRARTQLLFGEFLRRARRRTDSREHLRSALDAFDRLGAEIWAKRARAELRASGETTRKRDPSTLSQLTPQELQVARFVADGLSNKEVAAQLFLSPRTIDAHLRSVFSKLGVRSRGQLGPLLLSGRQGEVLDAVAPA